MTENKYHTIIVGGGIAGLTSAAYLSKAGKSVLLLEKNKECGGLVNSFTHHGFCFDAGVRALEDAGIILPMLKELGIKLDMVTSPVSLGIEKEILNIKDLSSLVEYQNFLISFFPESREEIVTVLKEIRKIMKDMDILYRIENPLFKDLKRDRHFLFTKLLPWLPKFIVTVRKINRMNGPIEDFLKKRISNTALIDMISQHFFKNTPTFFALSYFSLYLDYFYPKGGVGKISEALVNKIKEYGGEIKTETTIKEVLVEQRLIRDQDHTWYGYDHLIWAADLKTLYRIANMEKVKPTINYEKIKTQILENRGNDSVFSLFLEVNAPLESFKKIAHGHFFYTPSQQGLGETNRKELMELLTNFEKMEKRQILEWLDKFTKLNTYEISIPGLKDPDMAPPNQTGVIISFLFEYDLFKKVNEAGWLDEFTQEIENRMIQVISDSIYPMLKSNIIDQFSFSPLHIEKRVGSSEGAIVGWSFQKSMPVVNKIQISDRSVKTPMPSIYQAGQWAYSPAGVPMSILTGKLAANQVCNHRHNRINKKGFFS